MRKLTSFVKKILMIFSMLIGLSFLSSPLVAQSADPPHCFNYNNSGKLTALPDGACNYGLKEAGFVMGNLPNPLQPGHCYLWPAEVTAQGQDVPCKDPRLTAAVPIDSDILPCPHNTGEICVGQDIPNCFNPSTAEAFKQVTCTHAMGIALGKPLEDGHCYIAQGFPLIVEDSDCNTIKQQVQTTYQENAERQRAALTITNADRDKIRECGVNPSSDQATQQKELQDCLNANPIVNLIKIAVNVASGLVGVAITIMIIIGGIQYSAAAGNPNATQAAKKRITNAIIGLIAYLFLFAILQWLIPGGLL